MISGDSSPDDYRYGNDYDDYFQSIPTEWNCYFKDKSASSQFTRFNPTKKSDLVCANLNSQRKDGFFCDATIRIGLRMFTVHKAVLAANSSYFGAMLTGPFAGKTGNCIEIEDISETIFNDLLEYMYGSEIRIDFTTLKEIHMAADRLCLEALVEECKQFFQVNWHTFQGVYSIYTLYEIYHMAKEMEANKEGAQNHTPFFKFKELPFELILESLEERSVTRKDIEKEHWLTKLLVKWIFYKPEERLPRLGLQICSKLHLELIVEPFFNSLLKERHFGSVEGDENASQIFKTGLKDMFDKSHNALSKHGLEILFSFPDGSNYDHHVYVFNRDWKWESKSWYKAFKAEDVILNEDDLFIFGPKFSLKVNTCSQTAEKLPPFPEERTESIFAVVGNSVFVAGGRQPKTGRKLQEILELKSSATSWSCIKKIPKKTYVSSMISHAGCLYFLGNHYNDATGRDVYLYNFDSNSFDKISELCTPVFKPKLLVHDGTLYVIEQRSIQEIDLKRGTCLKFEVENNYEKDYVVVDVCSVKEGIVFAIFFQEAIALELVRPFANFRTEILGVIHHLKAFRLHEKGYLFLKRVLTQG